MYAIGHSALTYLSETSVHIVIPMHKVWGREKRSQKALNDYSFDVMWFKSGHGESLYYYNHNLTIFNFTLTGESNKKYFSNTTTTKLRL